MIFQDILHYNTTSITTSIIYNKPFKIPTTLFTQAFIYFINSLFPIIQRCKNRDSYLLIVVHKSTIKQVSLSFINQIIKDIDLICIIINIIPQISYISIPQRFIIQKLNNCIRNRFHREITD